MFFEPVSTSLASPALMADGSAAAPSLTYADDTDLGFYRVGDNQLGITAGGTKVGEWSSSGLQIDTVGGLDINPGSDADADLITVGVTGSPKLWWDESEDYFVLSKGLHSLGAFSLEAAGSQDITLTDENNDLIIQGGTATTDFLIEVAASDNDGTDDVALLIDNVGKAGATDTEALFLGWDAGNSRYEVRTQQTGSGSNRNINLFTAGNAGQLELLTGGSVTMSDTTASTGAGTGALQVSGGIRAGAASTFGGSLDLAGNELILDSDGDTSITADTDDQIDFRAGGSDVFNITSDGLNVEPGFGYKINAGANEDIILNGAVSQGVSFEADGTEYGRVDSSGLSVDTITDLGGGDLTITVTGDTLLNEDTNSTFVAGRARIDSRITDEAVFSHYDQVGTGDYSLRQAAGGDTVINAITGRRVYIANNNSLGPFYDGAKLDLNSKKLDMNGNQLILDADGDTSITADTDDQIDFSVGGTGGDDMRLDSSGLHVDTIQDIGGGDLTLNPAGNLKFGTHSTISSETVTGYITIKDSGGTTRKLAVVS